LTRGVPDRRLIALVGVVAALATAHNVDHVARGDVPWPPTAGSIAFVAVTLVIYGLIGVGLALYRRGSVGPRFWAIAAGAGAVFGWLGHFSPFTDQPPAHILGAYRSPVAGWLAVVTLVLLMVTLMVATAYAGYLWGLERRHPTRSSAGTSGR
jgi:hypothetical protein